MRFSSDKNIATAEVSGTRSHILHHQVFFYDLIFKNYFSLFLCFRKLRILAIYSISKLCKKKIISIHQILMLRWTFEGSILIRKVWFFIHSGFNSHLFHFVLEIYQQSFTKFLAQLLKMSNCKMNIFILWTTEWTFKSINIAVSKLFAQHCATCTFLLFHIEETAIFKRKSFEDFTHK